MTNNAYLDNYLKEGVKVDIYKYIKEGRSYISFLKVEPCSIYIYLTEGKCQAKIRLPFKVLPKDWNFLTKQVRLTDPRCATINKCIESTIAKITMTWHDELVKYPNITFKELVKKIKITVADGNFLKKDLMNVLDALEIFITNRDGMFKPNTIKKYTSFANSVVEYLQYENIRKLTFSEIDHEFLNGFQDYLISFKKNLNSSVAKSMVTFSTFMKFALESKYHSNKIFETYKIPEGNGDSRLTPLLKTELQMIIDLDLEVNSKLDKTRDMFVFACLTGQRFADLISLKFSDLTKDSNGEYVSWKLYQSKNNKSEAVYIPLIHSEIKKILVKRELYKDGSGLVFNTISNQKANEYIKEVALLAKLNRQITLVRYSGKNKIETIKPVYEMISFHWARATFITLCIEFGMNQHSIIKLSGHTNVNTLKHYIKLTKDQVQESYVNSGWMK